jgi:hypothetical protein
MKSDELQKNILRTYFTLRLGVVILSVALPVVLYVDGRLNHVSLLRSLSEYYGDPTGYARNLFVGILWTVGSFLILYKGFSLRENIALDLAGGFAVATAMVPCNCWCGAVGPTSKIHVFYAVSAFLCMGFVAVFCARDTITLLPDEKARNKFRHLYRIIGVLLVVSPAAAVVASRLLQQHANDRFFIEAFGAWVFAGYWLVKTQEFRTTSAEELAAHGKVKNVAGVGLVRVDEMGSGML